MIKNVLFKSKNEIKAGNMGILAYFMALKV